MTTRRYSPVRFRLLVFVFTLLFVSLVARFAWVQVVRAEHWREEARDRSTDFVEERAPRGRLVDANGRTLAVDEPRVHVGVSKASQWLRNGDVGELARLIGVDRRSLTATLKGHDGHVRVAQGVLLDPAARAALERDPAITLEEAPQRAHPYGDTAADLLGIVRSSGEGVSGLEVVYDEVLSGRPGKLRERRDRSRDVRERTVIEPPVPGADLELTLDLQVQGILERELERARVEVDGHHAQGLVMDPRTGDVLALAQVPLEPATLERSPDLDPHRVMGAADMFEPGSVFKIFTMASMLRHAVVDTSDVYDGGRTDKSQRRVQKEFPGGFRIRDVHPVARVSLRHAFAVSSNIIFATAASERLRRDEFHAALRDFGFGERLGTGLPGETRGVLPAPKEWVPRTQPTLAIGQRVGVNLLQLGTAAAAAISDGDLRAPRFVRALRHPDGRREELPPVVRRTGVVPPRVIPVLRELCREVVEEEYGTGENARIEGLDVGGKTGTAQVSDSHGYISGLYTLTFVGFVPVEDPRLLVVISVHDVQGEEVFGGNVAAPCFARVVREIASSTSYLDDVAVAAVDAQVERLVAPSLVGRSADEVAALARHAAWTFTPAILPQGGRVVGQVPPAGTPMRPGAVLQLAVAGGVAP